MFIEAATQSSNVVKLYTAYFPSEAVAHWYLSEVAARSLKNIEIHLEAATHLLKHIQKQLHKT